MSTLVAVQAGPNTLVQDLGRPGLAHLGMGAAGAMDRAALALANRLVGNPSDAAVLEILFGNASFATDEDTWIAVTGAWGSVTAGGRAV
ncbi:MAG TPA: allophanate hydrolase subunit 2 family protein, partial [Terrimesophilobacter sp.]|nr:allophanate hydrolase subunit 2 family protein [Terrimesophilobacter sp.]